MNFPHRTETRLNSLENLSSTKNQLKNHKKRMIKPKKKSLKKIIKFKWITSQPTTTLAQSVVQTPLLNLNVSTLLLISKLLPFVRFHSKLRQPSGGQATDSRTKDKDLSELWEHGRLYKRPIRRNTKIISKFQKNLTN